MAQSSNKTIAKNTIFLYFRMLLTMFVSLYTARVILNALGIEDYGLYNVIAGFIGMFSFINSALGTATSRFLTFELGSGNFEKLRNVFSTSFNTHLLLALIVILACETIGLWFVNNMLTIPEERLFASNVIYQYVIITIVLNFTQIPLNSMIISHERMNVYAYIGIFEAFAKLGIAYLVVVLPFDKLITLGTLYLLMAIVIYLFYHIYCKRHFPEYNFSLKYNKSIFQEMIRFSSWNFIGSLAWVLKNQGIVVLMNIFFSPVVNAAQAIAQQLANGLNAFVINFQTAMNPQIIKSYAIDDKKNVRQLIVFGSKYSFFLLLLITLPILIQTETILVWWLKTVPDYTAVFCKLILVIALIDSLSGPLGTAVSASGRIAKYQTWVGGLQLAILPVVYVFLKLGYSPEYAFYVSIAFLLATLIMRVYIVAPMVELPYRVYFEKVLLKVILVTTLSVFIVFLIIAHSSSLNFFILCFVTSAVLLINICLIGISRAERSFVKKYILKRFKHD